MDPNPFAFPNSLQELISTSSTLAAYLDRKLLVMLLDGRIVIGTICSFDQHCMPMGLLVQRGENVVLLGEQDPSLPELPPHMTKVSLPEILTAKKAEDGSSLLKKNLKKWMAFLD